MFVQIRLPVTGEIASYKFDVNFSDISPGITAIVQEELRRRHGIAPEIQKLSFKNDNEDVESYEEISPVDSGGPAMTRLNARRKIETYFTDLCHASMVFVDSLSSWLYTDVVMPENRIRTIGERELLPTTDLGAFRARLHAARLVGASDAGRMDRFLTDLRDIGMEGFLNTFQDGSNSLPVASSRELDCYEDLFKTSVVDYERFDKQASLSSAVLATYVGGKILHPVFICDPKADMEKLQLTQESGSHINMLVSPNGSPHLYHYSPQSVVAVLSRLADDLPVLICEVDSNIGRMDKYRMMLQGAVLCRQRQYLLKEHLKKNSFLLALFFNKWFTADLLLFHAVEHEVEIFTERYSLKERKDVLMLVRCLFNYRDTVLDGMSEYDGDALERFLALITESSKLPSLSQGKRAMSERNDARNKKPRTTTMTPGQATDADAILSEVKLLTCPPDTYIEPTKYENVVVVKGPSDETVGYIKRTNRQELRAFTKIRDSNSSFLLEHTVLPERVVEVAGEPYFFLRQAGVPLDCARFLTDKVSTKGHEIEIAHSMLQIFSCLHEFHIAHLDIKPDNILWDSSSQVVLIIDFDSSMVLDSQESSHISGIHGTTGYIAPEVEIGDGREWNVYLADAWSCGRVVQELITKAAPSVEKEVLGRIVDGLIAELNHRWTIRSALEVWKSWVQSHDGCGEYQTQYGAMQGYGHSNYTDVMRAPISSVLSSVA